MWDPHVRETDGSRPVTMSVRAVPFYCPYCAEQSLVPVGDKAFHCESCDRTFEINFLGVGDGAAP